MPNRSTAIRRPGAGSSTASPRSSAARSCALSRLLVAVQIGKDMKGAMERYAESVNRHQETWSRLLNRVPEEQRGAFMRALETSRRGPEDAQRAHQQGLKLLMERRLREKGRPLPPKPPQKPDGKKSMVPEERWTPRNADSR